MNSKLLDNGNIRKLRHTKIIFTIGPATEDQKTLQRLFQEGASICRLNMAHADANWTRATIHNIRQASAAIEQEVAIMMDIKGPEIRTGVLDAPIVLKQDDIFDFVIDKNAPKEQNIASVTVNYPGILKDVKAGNTLLVDNGLLRFEIIQILPDRLRCRVCIGGQLSSRRHINLPGVLVSLPALTDADKANVKLGAEEGVDFFALSFVRRPNDIIELRDLLHTHGSQAHIIAKIEDQSAISNLDKIIEISDGLMVARGDLGIECPFSQLPIIQRRAVNACRLMGKPVIIATHMLESMIQYPIPTRAEVSDVANAVYELADCVMLSGETTVGKYPLQCVQALDQIARSIESSLDRSFDRNIKLTTLKEKIKRSAVVLAQELGGTGIVIFSRYGITARVLSSLRPTHCPIYIFTEEKHIQRKLLMPWGLEPFVIRFDKNPELTIREAFIQLIEKKYVMPGDHLVVVTNSLVGEEIIDTIQVRQAIPLPLSHYTPVA